MDVGIFFFSTKRFLTYLIRLKSLCSVFFFVSVVIVLVHMTAILV